ncbi:MAG: MerR family DNA-binding transcriptional regulator [Hyphomonadaceae bacterium]|nr:MerR family DNA-binding transcriptional regulator [Hyphomonadaceae bacterium]
MKIGQLARDTGLSASRIRYYEKEGLIPSPGRGLNGYREFDKNTAERLRILDLGKSLGFSLAELRSLMPDQLDASLSRPAIIEALHEKVRSIDEHINQLKATKKRIKHAVDVLNNVEPDCDAPNVDVLQL